MGGGFTLSLPGTGGYSFIVIIGGVALHGVRLLTDRQCRSHDQALTTTVTSNYDHPIGGNRSCNVN